MAYGPLAPMGLTSKAFTKVAASSFITSRTGSAVSLKVTPIGGETATTRIFQVRSTMKAGATATRATTWWGFTEETVTISTVLRRSSAARWNVSPAFLMNMNLISLLLILNEDASFSKQSTRSDHFSRTECNGIFTGTNHGYQCSLMG